VNAMGCRPHFGQYGRAARPEWGGRRPQMHPGPYGVLRPLRRRSW
jgi:hypothetical protein